MKKRLDIFRVSQNFIRSVYLYYTHEGLAATLSRASRVTSNYIFQCIMNISFGLSREYLVELFYFGRGNNVLLSAKQKKGLKIGLSRMGGLGDAIIATSMVTALKERWPDSYIYVFVRSESQKAFLQRDKNIEQVVVVSDKVRLDSFNQIAMAKKLVSRYLDMYFLDRYVVKVYFRKGVHKELQEKLDASFAMYNLNFHHFPFFSNNLLIYNKSDYELRSACTGLKIDPKGLSFCLSDADCNILKELPASYITVHHGADNEFDAGSGGNNKLQTKNWRASRWAEVARFIKNSGYAVVQLGTTLDEQIPGAIDYRGKTTFPEAGAIIKGAVVHLDTEGGLVHLSKALGKKSIVLFGPTAVEFYGYHDNINIRSDVCKNCWWSKPDWVYRCPVGHEVPLCMDTITVEMVTDAVTQYLAQYRSRTDNSSYELIDFSLFDPKLIDGNRSILRDIYQNADLSIPDRFNKGSVNNSTGCYIHGSKNWEYLYVVKMMNTDQSRHDQQAVLDAGSGRGALQVHLSSQGDYRIHSCDYDYNDLSPDKTDYGRTFINTYKDAIHFKTCSIFNLPYDDESFDVVYCVSVLEHFTGKKYALRELLRVLKHEGLLIVTFDITSDDHAQMLEDGYRVEIPTDSSLRKFFLDELALSIRCDASMVKEAQKKIAAYQIEGIPQYLTVGGICIRKKAGKLAPDRQ